MARRSVDDELRNDVLVDIAKEDERRFGCSGKMLKPSRMSVEALVEKIPQGMVMTAHSLRKELAKRHNAQVTCPFITKRALMAIAEDPKTTAPFWRVVLANGEMIAAYPGGRAEQARRLKNEGVMIAGRLGTYKVRHIQSSPE
jgi:alkylated DNA nucleotide flippase Atl1